MPRRRPSVDWEISPAEMLEQGFHLLRELPVSVLAWGVLGPVPFALGLLFFWSDMSRSGEAAVSAFGWAVVLALLYAWLKITQAMFARGVWAQLVPEQGMPPLGPRAFFRRAAALVFLSAFGLPLQFLAANLIVPFAWTYAFFQNATVLAFTQESERRELRALAGGSIKLSHHEPLPHHLMLIMLFVFFALVWAALFAAGLLVPYLFKVFTGVENAFTRNTLAAAFNTLYLAVITSLAWLVLSPFYRVVYVLRNFHALARPTGLDLLSRLRSLQRAAARATVIVLMGGALLAGASAQETPTPAPPAPEAARFQEAIRATLADRAYQWRLPREKDPNAAADKTENFLAAGFRKMAATIRSVFQEISRVVEMVFDQIFGRARGLPTPDGSSLALGGSALRGLVYLLGTAILAGLLYLLIRFVLARRRRSLPAAAVEGAAAGPVDLADEETLASQLPEDQWLQLARAQLAAGDTRLAVRALFLASLATLGEQRLVDIARTKTNRDYREEVQRRSLTRRETPEIFTDSVGVFERVWYGWHDAPPAWVQRLMDNYEQLRRVPST